MMAAGGLLCQKLDRGSLKTPRCTRRSLLPKETGSGCCTRRMSHHERQHLSSLNDRKGSFADIHSDASASADRVLMSTGRLDHGVGLSAHNGRNTRLLNDWVIGYRKGIALDFRWMARLLDRLCTPTLIPGMQPWIAIPWG